MASLRYSPAITYASTIYYLPPWITVEAERSQFVDSVPIPLTDDMIFASIQKNQGTRLALRVSSVFDSPTTQQVLALIEAIWTHCSGHEFNLFIWNDRAWSVCALSSLRERMDEDPLTYLKEVGIEILCTKTEPDPSLQLIFADYDNEYPYADVVRGTELGNMIDPGELTPVTQTSIQTESNTFPGQLEAVTLADEEHKFFIGGAAGRSWRLKSIQITGSNRDAATGTTTLRVATYAVGGVPGSHLEASISNLVTYGGQTVGAITVTTGDALYVYCTAAGGHQDVRFRVILEAL